MSHVACHTIRAHISHSYEKKRNPKNTFSIDENFFFFHKKTTEKTWFSLRELQNTLCISVAFMDGIIFSLEDFKNLRKRFK